MKQWMKYGLVGVVALIVGIAVAGGSGSDKAKTTGQASKPDAPAVNRDTDGDGISDEHDSDPNVNESVAATREPENADGSYELSCTYELGDHGDTGDPAKGYRFIAGGTLENTGNIGIRVRVNYKWKQSGGVEAITEQRTYRVRRNETRDVGVTVPATSDQIDLIQALPGDDCTAKATIVDTFGQPPLEN